MTAKFILVATLSLVTSHVALGQNQALDAAAWREDLRVLASELPKRHPDAFFRLKRTTWDSAVAAIDRRAETMTRNQALVSLMQLVALVRDGHTSINPLFDPSLGLHTYPVEFVLFNDGLFIKSAAPAVSSLAGARIRRIGPVRADSAYDRVASLVGQENEWWARAVAPRYMAFAEVLTGLGLAESNGSVALELERDGKVQRVIVAPGGVYRPAGHNPMAGADRTGWSDMRAAGDPPRWLSHQGEVYWHEFDSHDSTLYVSYRGVVNASPSNTDFWRSVFAAADTLSVKQFVVDLRENSGGNSFYNRQVIRGIVARPRIDQKGRLFAIIGPQTFSAAMNLALDLEAWTNVTFVGAPTGNASMFFGDHEQLQLPRSGITVNISTLPWHPDDPRDKRDFLAPALYTPMSSTDYRNNVDPAMRAIHSAPNASLREQLAAAALRGDSTGAARIVAQAQSDTLFRFRRLESEINALGYELLNRKQTAPALLVFRVGANAYPRSANTWDSLAEALILAGQRDAGIAMYRKALSVDPTWAPSRQALEKLGVHDLQP
ncbi:MAG: hypothetical protein ABI877_12665 [Gemmatimonadaceae bacterium]